MAMAVPIKTSQNSFQTAWSRFLLENKCAAITAFTDMVDLQPEHSVIQTIAANSTPYAIHGFSIQVKHAHAKTTVSRKVDRRSHARRRDSH